MDAPKNCPKCGIKIDPEQLLVYASDDGKHRVCCPICEQQIGIMDMSHLPRYSNGES